MSMCYVYFFVLYLELGKNLFLKVAWSISFKLLIVKLFVRLMTLLSVKKFLEHSLIFFEKSKSCKVDIFNQAFVDFYHYKKVISRSIFQKQFFPHFPCNIFLRLLTID